MVAIEQYDSLWPCPTVSELIKCLSHVTLIFICFRPHHGFKSLFLVLNSVLMRVVDPSTLRIITKNSGPY